jgi:hypothetical protein
MIFSLVVGPLALATRQDIAYLCIAAFMWFRSDKYLDATERPTIRGS